jgi:hypothetical protein
VVARARERERRVVLEGVFVQSHRRMLDEMGE